MKNNEFYPLMQHTKIARKGVEMAEALNRDMREMADLEKPRKYRERIFHERRQAMAKELFSMAEQEATRLRAALAEDARKWTEAAEKNVHTRAAKLELSRARFAAMGTHELHQHLAKVVHGEYITVDPVEVDAAFEALRITDLDPSEIEGLRELAVSKKYDQPWRQSPEARQAEKEIRLYSDMAKSPYSVPVVLEGGETTLIAFDDILDGADAVELQGAYNDA